MPAPRTRQRSATPGPSTCPTQVQVLDTPVVEGRVARSKPRATTIASNEGETPEQPRGPQPRSRASSADSSTGIPGPEEETVEVAGIEYVIDIDRRSTSQNSVKYGLWASRRSVHVGLHYFETVRRYGLVSILTALEGEMTHK